MNHSSPHNFHIPVMGVAFTLDSPLKVARYGISSVISLVDDNAIERMREFYAPQDSIPYVAIDTHDHDHRARRITEYLNQINRLITCQMETIATASFEEGSEIVKYFEMLPEFSAEKILYTLMKEMEDGEMKSSLQQSLRNKIVAGSVDVNIMTKLDRTNYDKKGDALPHEFSDAMAALRGFANSDLCSSIIFSAGMNPRLYSYCETFPDFFPDEHSELKKKIILKVSDFRSAQVQGRFLAKKGVWVSEYRIESGLNCGGHAFATEGYLLGPALEEFKQKREQLAHELYETCNAALIQKGKTPFKQQPDNRVTVQGGIGTAAENYFLIEHYQLDGTGWGSPFLLVPEATNIDNDTLQKLVNAKPEDYYLSNASPLGIPFNNLRTSSGEADRKHKIEKGRPGSACYNKYLEANTEFTEKPICTASRLYQSLKINQLKLQELSEEERSNQIDKVLEKECICQGLGTAVFLKNEMPPPHKITAVSICPGPNLAFFSRVSSLHDMIDHIYGRKQVLIEPNRPNMFLNEMKLYIDYLKNEATQNMNQLVDRKLKHLQTFKANLLEGVEYYKSLASQMIRESDQYKKKFNDTLHNMEMMIQNLHLPELSEVV